MAFNQRVKQWCEASAIYTTSKHYLLQNIRSAEEKRGNEKETLEMVTRALEEKKGKLAGCTDDPAVLVGLQDRNSGSCKW